MMEWLMSLIGEEFMLSYITYYLIAFSSLIVTLLYILFHIKVTFNLICRFKLERTEPVIHQCIAAWRFPILRWRIRCLSKLSDEEDLTPVY
ncbi:hypothetical protein ERX37_01240 [Macrococcus hajekii]|uniref:Uncharacterized protein n=1 Tax=Macrococcus hajekii TaxID=198482 RepID=A0A4R6BLR6_9STAP|nr:hypothetical protein [Macrococcus hajekii]TDM02743.1 hypothetical protein ERX37_01240 [Macrococcus hajekii]GGB03511.1 hypothetical protein GCM10007190_09420 [Macrococcus hajekii]